MEKEKKYLKLTNSLYSSIEFLPDEEPLKRKIKEKSLRILGNLILKSVSSYGNPVSFFANKAKTGISEREVLIEVASDVEILKSYLNLAEEQNMVDSFNFLVLSKEYDAIKKQAKHDLSEIEQQEEEKANQEKEQKRQKREKEESTSKARKKQESKKESFNKASKRIKLEKSKVRRETRTPDVSKNNFKKRKDAPLSDRQKGILRYLKRRGKGQVSDLKSVFPQVSKRTLRRDLDDLRKKNKVQRAGEWNNIFYKIKR